MRPGSLLASLLLTLLLGAAAPPIAPAVTVHADDVSAISAVDALSADPALPAVPAATAPAADATGTLRDPARASGGTDAGAAALVPTALAASLERAYLDYARALSRARRSLPATCCKPPPVTL